MRESAPHVVIVGGGITGLSAAYFLQQWAQAQSIPLHYTLVEEASRLGGKVLTEKVEGFLIEGGPDSFITQKPAALELARELGLEERLLGTNQAHRTVYVLHRGRLLPLPEGVFLVVPTRLLPFAFSPLFSLRGKVRMALDCFLPPRPGDDDESLADFIRRRLGREALERVAEPLMGGIYVCSPENLSLLATFPRFRMLEKKYGSLIRGMLRVRRSQPPRPQSITPFMTFREGMEELVTALARRLTGQVLLGQRAMGWERREGGYRLLLADGTFLEADAVVLTFPAYIAARWVRPFLPEAARLLEAIPYVSTATVSLGYKAEDCPHPLKGFGFVVPRREPCRLLACTWTSSKFPHRAPPGHVLLRAFLGGWREEGWVEEATEEEMVAIVREEFRRLLGIQAPPKVQRVYRWIRANPQYQVGHLERVRRLQGLLEEHLPGAFLAGSPYEGLGIPDCIAQGREVAQKVLAWLTSPPGQRETLPPESPGFAP